MAGGQASSVWSLQGSLWWSTSTWRLSQLRQLPQQHLPSKKAIWSVQQWPGPQGSPTLLRQVSWWNLLMYFGVVVLKYPVVKTSVIDISGILTRKEDVLMNSVPTTTREEMALFRTSGGCQSTGQVAHKVQSTTAGPSTPTNLLPWTLAPRRLRSLPRTPAHHWSGLQSWTLPQTQTGTTGKHKVCQGWLRNWSGCFVQGQSHMLLMDKSGLANHKLTVGKGINMYPLFQQNQTILLFSRTVTDCETFVPWRKKFASSCHLHDEKN